MRRARIADIVTIASRLTGIPESDIVGPRRLMHLCAIRGGIYEVAVIHDHTYVAIGRAVGGRDHASVINGIKSFNRYQRYLPDFPQFVKAIDKFSRELPAFVADTDWRAPVKFRPVTARQLEYAKEAEQRRLASLPPVHPAYTPSAVRTNQRVASERLLEALQVAA